jgi:membrane protein implicated in regulation of membrane protease activity
MIEFQPALVWLAIGILLLIAEVLAPGFFLMWLGIAALGTGVLVEFADPALAWQVIAFAMFAVISIAAGLRLRRRTRPAQFLNTAESGLVGRSARVLGFTGTEWRVRVGDSDWAARLANGTPAPEPGAQLRVVAVDGIVLVVGT